MESFRPAHLTLINKFPFTTALRFTESDFIKLIKSNQQEQVDSITLKEQFNQKIKQAEDVNLACEMCIYYSGLFNKRMDNDQAIEICQVAINLLKALDVDTTGTQVQFKLQQMHLNYQMGNLHEVHQLALAVQEAVQKLNMNPEATDITIDVAFQLMDVQEIEQAMIYLKKVIDYVDSNKEHKIDSVSLFSINELYSKCLFSLARFEESIKYSKINQELIENKKVKMQTPESVLLRILYAYQRMGKKVEVEQILKKLQQYPNVKPEQLDGKNYIPVQNSFISIKTYSDEVEKIQKSEEAIQAEEKKLGKKIFWDLTIDREGLAFFQKKQLNEAKRFYENILTQLDDTGLNWFRRANVLERLAELHFTESNIPKAIELSLEVHDLLLEKRNFILINDSITLLNINHLKRYYHEQKDFEKAYEWGKKWNTYCLTRKYFTMIYDQHIMINMFMHLNCLQSLKKHHEMLAYTKVIAHYLNSFQIPQQEYFNYLLTLQMKRFEVQLVLNMTAVAKETAKSIINTIAPYKQQQMNTYFTYVRLAAFLSTKTNDMAGTIKYGDEYYSLRKSFETDDEFLQERQMIINALLQHSVRTNQTNGKEEYVKEANTLAEKSKDPLVQYQLFFLSYQFYVNSLNFDKATHYHKRTEEIIQKHYKGKELENYLVTSLKYCQLKEFLNKKEYQTLLNQIVNMLETGLPEEFDVNEIGRMLEEVTKVAECRDKANEIMDKYFLKVQK